MVHGTATAPNTQPRHPQTQAATVVRHTATAPNTHRLKHIPDWGPHPFTSMSAAASLASPDSHSLSIRTMCRAREVSPECQPCVSLTHLSAFTPRRLTGDEVQIPSLARKVPQPPHLFLLPLVGPRILIPPGLCTSYFLSFKGLGIGAQLSP